VEHTGRPRLSIPVVLMGGSKNGCANAVRKNGRRSALLYRKLEVETSERAGFPNF